jgi:ribosomal protein S18 acetylase RimI-like enzyme
MAIKYTNELSSMDGFWCLFEMTGWNMEYQISKDDLETVVRNSCFVVAAYDEERLVGFGRIVTDGVLHAMVYDLITDPEYRERGVGSEVLARLVKKCKESGIRDIQLFCATGRRKFYEKRGFVVRPEQAPGMEHIKWE